MAIAAGFIFDGLELGEVSAPRSAAANARLIEASDKWAAGAWATFQAKGNKPRKICFTARLLGGDGKVFETADITLVSDKRLFLQLAEFAIDHGAPGMTEALKAIVDAKGSIAHSGLAIFLSAHEAVERFLAGELARAETQASFHADVQTRAMREANKRHSSRFETRTYRSATSRVLVLPGTQKQDLFAKLVAARKHRLKILDLESEIKSRDRKDGSTVATRQKARKKDNYRALLVEFYAGPHRTETIALEKLQEEIFDIFPPALAVLGQIESDLRGWQPVESAPEHDKPRMNKLAEKYDTLLWEALVTQAEVVGTIERSLTMRSVPRWVEAYFGLDHTDRQTEGSLTGYLIRRLMAPAPGVADAILEVNLQGPIFGVLGFLEKREAALRENHVLARAPLLKAMIAKAGADSATIFDATLLDTFRRDLARAQCIAQEEGRLSTMNWHRLEMGLAICGLVVGLVSLPFGAGEAILPASLGWISALAAGSLIVGTVILLARTVMVALNETGLRSDTAIRDRLIDLGREDPQALEDLARFITGRRELAGTLAKTVVEELIELASQRFLPPLAFALDLRDHYQAMDSLSADLFETAEAG